MAVEMVWVRIGGNITGGPFTVAGALDWLEHRLSDRQRAPLGERVPVSIQNGPWTCALTVGEVRDGIAGGWLDEVVRAELAR